MRAIKTASIQAMRSALGQEQRQQRYLERGMNIFQLRGEHRLSEHAQPQGHLELLVHRRKADHAGLEAFHQQL